jgi:hypothetical protein
MSQAANGNFKLTMYLRPDQWLWLKAQALNETMLRGGGKPDYSAILRAMIDKTRTDMEAAMKPKKKARK